MPTGGPGGCYILHFSLSHGMWSEVTGYKYHHRWLGVGGLRYGPCHGSREGVPVAVENFAAALQELFSGFHKLVGSKCAPSHEAQIRLGACFDGAKNSPRCALR